MPSSHQIKAILFDLDGTLRHNRPSYTDVFFDISSRLGAPSVPEAQYRAKRWMHYYWAKSDELLSDRRMYDDQTEAFYINHARLVLIAMGCTPDLAATLAPKAYQMMKDEFKPQDWVPPDVHLTLEELKAAKYPLAVLSNRLRPFHEQMETLGLTPYFEFALHAGEAKSWKPDPQVFHQAVERLGYSPYETLYVGDNYFADVVGARRANLVPVLIDPEGLFPEADCAVIHQFGDLKELLLQKEYLNPSIPLE